MLRNPPINNWADPGRDKALLLFAQRFEEVLFDYTVDSFRVPALNTHGRAKEVVVAVGDCERGALRQDALRPIYEELAHSLKIDEAAKRIMPELAGTYTDKRLWEQAGVEDLGAHAQVIQLQLEDSRYLDSLRARIREAILEEQLGAVEAYAPPLAVELMSEGYSREYLFHSVRNFFFKRRRTSIPIDGIAAFDRFFEELSAEEREWTLYLRGSECLSVLTELFEADDFEIETEPPAIERPRRFARDWLNRPRQGRVFIRMTVSNARDAQGAHLQGLSFLELMSQYIRYHLHRSPVEIDPDALVIPPDADPLILQAPKSATEKRPDPHRPRLGEAVSSTFRALGPRTLRGESTTRILSSLEMHGSAIRAETEEAQLLGLWSAIESLLPLSRADAGIKRLKELAVPLLSLGYPVKILTQLQLATQKALRGEYRRIMEPLTGEDADGDLHRFVGALFDPRWEEVRMALLTACAHNHLLRFRVESYTRRFGTGEDTLSEVEEHQQRVDWHMSRIYRARNALVHDGRLGSNARPLIENLHDYYHYMLTIIGDTYARYERPISIEAVVVGVGASYQAHLASLRRLSGERTNMANAPEILWGFRV